MYELLLRTETLLIGLQSPVLLGIGAIALVIGLVFWLAGTRYSTIIMALLGAVIGAAVHEHDREQDQDQNAAHVNEHLGKRQEAESVVCEEPGDSEQERAKTERHAHDFACEDHVRRARTGARASASPSASG